MTEQAAWAFPDSVLRVREASTVMASPDVVEPFGADLWANLGLRVTRTLDSGDAWRVTADRYVGLARLPSVGGYAPQLEVAPKIDLDMFFLADYAFRAERDLLKDSRLRAEMRAMRADPPACLLAWFLAEIEEFAIRHLRRDYVLQKEVFNGRIRGRLMLSEYLQRYRAAGQGALAPCQYFDFTHDNLANQILRRTLREIGRLSALVPLPEARHVLRTHVDRVLPFFGGVSDRHILDADFNRLRLRSSMRHYAPIIAKCRALLHGAFLSPESGRHGQDAFLWDMSILFERALAGVLATSPGLSLERRWGRARVVDGDGTTIYTSAVRPDLVIRGRGGRVLLDAKYKETGATGAAPASPNADAEAIDIPVSAAARVRVSRSDIYQALSYGQHDRYRPAETGLVFPIVLAADHSLPAPFRVTGFVKDVWLLFIDVGASAADNLPAFRSSLPLAFQAQLAAVA